MAEPDTDRQQPLSHDQWVARIRERAHRLWEAEGAPEGRDQEFWFRAEREIAGIDAPNP